MQKFVTFEKTFTRKEIEQILREHIAHKLSDEDIDFRQARWMQDDFTFKIENGEALIEVVIILDDVKLRNKWTYLKIGGQNGFR